MTIAPSNKAGVLMTSAISQEISLGKQNKTKYA